MPSFGPACGPSVAAVYIAGTRTFAAEVVDFVRDAGLELTGLLEPYDRDRVGTTIHDQPVTWLEDTPRGDARLALVGTGEPARREIVDRLGRAGFQLATLVHPTAHVAPSATVGTGAMLGPGAVVGARSAIDDHAVLGRGALVGHHTEIGPFATLGPGANVAGNARVGPDAFIGMAAAVRDHVNVGAGAIVAMGAVVVADVPDRAQVRGVPAQAVQTPSPT
jgi:sugar O-acyltransferase (sialic acid O-acetyltransferase NeuD family)